MTKKYGESTLTILHSGYVGNKPTVNCSGCEKKDSCTKLQEQEIETCDEEPEPLIPGDETKDAHQFTQADIDRIETVDKTDQEGVAPMMAFTPNKWDYINHKEFADEEEEEEVEPMIPNQE